MATIILITLLLLRVFSQHITSLIRGIMLRVICSMNNQLICSNLIITTHMLLRATTLISSPIIILAIMEITLSPKTHRKECQPTDLYNSISNLNNQNPNNHQAICNKGIMQTQIIIIKIMAAKIMEIKISKYKLTHRTILIQSKR